MVFCDRLYSLVVQWAADGGTEEAELWAEVWELDVFPAEDGGQSGRRRGRLLCRPQTAALYAQGIVHDSLTDWQKNTTNAQWCNPDPSSCSSAFRLSCPSDTRSFIRLSPKLFTCCRKERWRTGKITLAAFSKIKRATHTDLFDIGWIFMNFMQIFIISKDWIWLSLVAFISCN